LKKLENFTKEGDSPVNFFISCLGGLEMGSLSIMFKVRFFKAANYFLNKII